MNKPYLRSGGVNYKYKTERKTESQIQLNNDESINKTYKTPPSPVLGLPRVNRTFLNIIILTDYKVHVW